MKIEPIDGGSLRVWLTDEELEQWSLHETEPDRRRVRRLVRQVMAMVGRRPSRIIAEMIPVMGGGVLLISPLLRPNVGQPAVYRLENEDALLDLMEQWAHAADEPTPLCALYAAQEGYRLAVYPDEPLSPRQTHLLLEYGTPAGWGEAAVAHAEEYGRLLAVGEVLTGGGRRLPEPGDPEH